MSIRSEVPERGGEGDFYYDYGFNESKEVQKEIVEVKTRIDMSFDSDIRPPRHSRRRR